MTNPTYGDNCEIFYMTFGYIPCEKIQTKKDTESDIPPVRRFMLLNNVLNAASILLSPLVGIVRIIATIITYFLTRKTIVEDSSDDQEYILGIMRSFTALEVGRGLLEICCLGPLLGIVDLVSTLKAQEMLCFKKA